MNLKKKFRIGKNKKNYEDALSYYNSKQYKDAYYLFNELTKNGDAEAAYYLAKCSMNIQNSDDNILQLIKDSANAKVELAMLELAQQYQTGHYVIQDDQKAVYWYEQTIKQANLAQAQYELGKCYYNGKGVEKNIEKAVEWFKKAAEQEYAPAQNYLGHCYSVGKGVVQDKKQAFYYYEKASEQKYAKAQYNLGIFYKNGQYIEKDLKKACELFLESARQGHVKACIEYAKMNYNGKYYTVSIDNALSWLDFALTQDPTNKEKGSIYYEYTNIYLNHRFDMKKVLKYAQKAIKLKSEKIKDFANQLEEIQSKANKIFDEAYSLYEQKNYQEAYPKFMEAGKLGRCNACIYAGIIQEKGYLGKINYGKAFDHYQDARDYNNVVSYRYLANLYYKGLGINKNIDKAIYYYEKSVEHNSEKSMIQLIQIYKELNDIDLNKKIIPLQEKLAFLGKERVHGETSFELAKYYRMNNDLHMKYLNHAIECKNEDAIFYMVDNHCPGNNSKKIFLSMIVHENDEAKYRFYKLTKENDYDYKQALGFFEETLIHNYLPSFYEMAKKHYDKNEYNLAIDYLLRSKDYAKSCVLISKMYEKGQIVKKDRELSNAWLYRSMICKSSTYPDMIEASYNFKAMKNDEDPDARYRLLSSIEVASFRGGAVAFELIPLMKKLRKENKEYQELLNFMLLMILKDLLNKNRFDERRVFEAVNSSYEDDTSRALIWYSKKMADRGNAEAQKYFGRSLYVGRFFHGIVNHGLAKDYLTMAAKQNNCEAMTTLYSLCKDGEQENEYEEFKESIDVIVDTVDKHVASFDQSYYDHLKSMLLMSSSLMVVTKDLRIFGNPYDSINTDLYSQSIENKIQKYKHDAQFSVVKIEQCRQRHVYVDGRGKYSQEEAMMWLNKAADLKDVFALYLLGSMNYESLDPKMREKGIKFLEEAAKLGDYSAKEMLSRIKK